MLLLPLTLGLSRSNGSLYVVPVIVSRLESLDEEEDQVADDDDCVELECCLDLSTTAPAGSIPVLEGVRKGFKMLPMWLKVLLAALPALCKGDRPGRFGCCCCFWEGEVCAVSQGNTTEEEPSDKCRFPDEAVGEGIDRVAEL